MKKRALVGGPADKQTEERTALERPKRPRVPAHGPVQRETLTGLRPTDQSAGGHGPLADPSGPQGGREAVLTEAPGGRRGVTALSDRPPGQLLTGLLGSPLLGGLAGLPDPDGVGCHRAELVLDPRVQTRHGRRERLPVDDFGD